MKPEPTYLLNACSLFSVLCWCYSNLVHVIPMENEKKNFIKAINQTNQLLGKSQ